MPTIISFVNQKGGVGKTTSVINVASSLAKNSDVVKEKKRILIIDMDPQANATQVYSEITDEDDSIYNLLTQYANSFSQYNKLPELDKITQKTYIDNLDILPSNVLLSSAELELVNAHGREMILKRIIRENPVFFGKYDYILIDCQPSLGLLTINSIIASDYVFVPIRADVFSLKGLELLNETISKLQDVFEINATISGLFFTHVEEEEDMFKESFNLCKENYKDLVFNSVIRYTPSIDQANAMDQSVLDFDPKSIGAIDYTKFTEELLTKLS